MARSVARTLADAQPTISFEFMPPRDEAAQRQLWSAIRDLETLSPSFVSVTYGAGGSTRDRTIEMTERIATDTTLLPVAHLTAVNHSVAELRTIIGRLAEAGITNVLAIRGDPPGDPMGDWVKHADGVTYAAELVALVRSYGDFCVGVAAFAHKHPRSASVEADTREFIAKCRAGADYAITQMIFDADDYLRLRDPGRGRPAATRPSSRASCRSPTSARSPVPSSCPAHRSRPPWPRSSPRVADDPAAVRALGIEQMTRLCQRLLDEDVPGLHFITFNRSRATREVWQALSVRSVPMRTAASAAAHAAVPA